MQMMPKIPAPRAYLDGLDADDPATGLHYANMLEAKILEEGPETILAFIVEPVGGASTGALVPPAGYMSRIRGGGWFYPRLYLCGQSAGLHRGPCRAERDRSSRAYRQRSTDGRGA